MKYKLTALISLISLVVVVGSAHAQNIAFNGYLQTDDRIALQNDHDFTWHEYRLALNLNAGLTDNTRFYSEIWLRSRGIPYLQHSSDLYDKSKVSPLDLDLREAYMDFYGFLFKDLDMRIGRQRIAWGSADKLNPTDNLNPNDLEDIWDFGRHLGSDCLNLSYYLNDYSLSLVYIPLFTPAILPEGNWTSLLMPAFNIPAGLTINSITDSIIQPEPNYSKGSTFGFKISKRILGYDLSLNYVNGRDDLPMMQTIMITPTVNPGEVDIKTELIFPKTQIFGLDMAGAVADIGIWAEAALILPEEVVMTTDLSALGMGIVASVILEHEIYAKYVAGADYTFKNGIYINIQYVHGFFHEKGADNLEDYIMLGLEWPLFNDKLKLMPISGGIEIKDYEEFEDNYAVIYSPEISYHPVDNVNIDLGATWIEGTSTTTFGRAKDNNEAYLKIKYSF
jgi:hypothetical protein